MLPCRVFSKGSEQIVVAHDAGLVIQPPLEHPFIRPSLNWFWGKVSPDGIGNVEIDGHAELGAPVPKRIQARVVRVWPHGAGRIHPGRHATPFINNLAYSGSTGAVNGFQRCHRFCFESRLVNAAQVEVGP